MLTELIELGWKMKEQMKDTQNKVRYSGNQQGKEGNQDSNQWFGTKGRNKHPTGTEWRNKNLKNEERLRNLWDNLKYSNIQIIEVPEGEEQQQEIENLFEKIMKENLPNLAKEIDFQEVPGSPKSPTEVGPKEEHTKACHH